LKEPLLFFGPEKLPAILRKYSRKKIPIEKNLSENQKK